MAGYGGYVSAYGYGGSVVGMGPSMRRVSEVYETYYHHTTIAGAKAILASGIIFQSEVSGTDAIFGSGVYVTKLGLETARVDVAKNNYDGTCAFYMSNLAKTSAVFEILLPKSKVRKTTSGRDIYLHAGNIIIDPNTVRVYTRYD